MKKKTNEEKKSELTELTFQIRLTRQTLDSCRESLITKWKKQKLTGYELTGLTRQIWNPYHESLITK
jgi:hypothetical protein